MSSDIVMDDVVDLHNDQSPINLKMSSQKRDKLRPYSRPTAKGISSAAADLNTLRKERAWVLLSSISSDKWKKIGHEVRPTQIVQKPNTDKGAQSDILPYLFWNLANSDSYRSIWWSADGTAVVIHEMMFIAEILEKNLFGSKSIKSFYHQLYLYGFTRPEFNHGSPSLVVTAKEVKVRITTLTHNSAKSSIQIKTMDKSKSEEHECSLTLSFTCHPRPFFLQVFAHPYFQRGCRHLLAQLKRHEGTNASVDGCKLNDEMFSSTSHRPTVQSSCPMSGLKPPCLLAAEQVGLDSQTSALADQLKSLLLCEDNVAQPQKPVLSPKMTLHDPSRSLLFLMLTALESKRRALIAFLQKHRANSAAPWSSSYSTTG